MQRYDFFSGKQVFICRFSPIRHILRNIYVTSSTKITKEYHRNKVCTYPYKQKIIRFGYCTD